MSDCGSWAPSRRFKSNQHAEPARLATVIIQVLFWYPKYIPLAQAEVRLAQRGQRFEG